MKEFLDNIFGTLTVFWYLSAFVFALIGLFIRWYVKTNMGVKNNPETPDKFSFRFWLQNNFFRKFTSVLTTMLVVFLCLRFASDWFGVLPSMGFSVVIGLAFDWFFDFVKKLINKVPVKNEEGDEHLMK